MGLKARRVARVLACGRQTCPVAAAAAAAAVRSDTSLQTLLRLTDWLPQS